MITTQTFSPEDRKLANQSREGSSPQQVLEWAVDNFHPRLTMATAFGAEGCCLIHMLAEIRNERRPKSRYAALDNCRMEVAEAEAMMRRAGIRSVLIPLSEGGNRIGDAGPYELRVLGRNAKRAQELLSTPVKRRRHRIASRR